MVVFKENGGDDNEGHIGWLCKMLVVLFLDLDGGYIGALALW